MPRRRRRAIRRSATGSSATAATARFVDVTEASGLAKIARRGGYGLGVAVGDFDNDGRPDLFVSRLTTYALYRNRGDGTFEDATERAGLAGVRDNPTSAAFADLDNDGDLDLYVCHYMIWDPEQPAPLPERQRRLFLLRPQQGSRRSRPRFPQRRRPVCRRDGSRRLQGDRRPRAGGGRGRSGR